MTGATGSDDESATGTADGESARVPFRTRLARVIVSVVVLTGVTVVLGYGGWVVLTAASTLGAYDPEPVDGESLRARLLAWPERNREVMRTDGRAELPWRP